MAKFNKDTFINDITSRVQNAINKGVITKEDIASGDAERLEGFIKYELTESIEDRKFAIDVLKDFNYDEKTPWTRLQEEFGTFSSVMDLALVNLWKFLEAEGATQYEHYDTNVDFENTSKLTSFDKDNEYESDYNDEDDMDNEDFEGGYDDEDDDEEENYNGGDYPAKPNIPSRR